MGIADHFRIPALFGHIDTRLAVVTYPIHQIAARRIADAVAVLLTPIAAAVAIAEEHVVLAIRVEDIGARLRLVFLHPTFNQIFVQLGPAQTVIRYGHADLVDGFCTPVDRLPLATRDVEQLPLAVEATDLRPAEHKGLVRAVTQDRAITHLGEGLAAVPTDCRADGNIEGHGFASGPSGVVGADDVAVEDHRDWVGAKLVEFAQPTEFEDRLLGNLMHLEEILPIQVDEGGVADVLPIGVSRRPA